MVKQKEFNLDYDGEAGKYYVEILGTSEALSQGSRRHAAGYAPSGDAEENQGAYAAGFFI